MIAPEGGAATLGSGFGGWVRKTSTLPAVILAAAALLALGLSQSHLSPALVLAPALLLVVPLALWYGAAALKGERWALAVFLFLSVLVFAASLRTRDAAASGADLQSLLKLALFCGAFAIGLAGLRFAASRLLQPVGLLLLLYWTCAALSTAISPTPAYSLAAAFGLLGWILLSATLGCRLTLRQLLLLLVSVLSFVLAVSWGLFLLLPDLGQYQHLGSGHVRFTGLAPTPNAAALLAGLNLICLAALHRSTARVSAASRPAVGAHLLGLCLAVMSLAALILAQSKAVILATLLALAVIYVPLVKRLSVMILALCLGATLYFATPDISSLSQGLLSAVSRSGNAAEVTSLTGRVPLWNFVMREIMEAPVFGHGYASARVLISENYVADFGRTFASAHNMFLQSLLDLGMLGTLFLVGIMGASFLMFLRRRHPFRDAIFVMVVLVGMTEAGVSNTATVLTLVWLVSLLCPEAENDEQPRLLVRAAGAPLRRERREADVDK